MKSKQELEMLIRVCERTGVSKSQAKLMASRLSKRADQLSEERKISRIEAMNHLLTLLSKGIAS